MSKNRKDEIIARQSDIISKMTERRLKHVGADFWSGPATDQSYKAESRGAADASHDTVTGEAVGSAGAAGDEANSTAVQTAYNMKEKNAQANGNEREDMDSLLKELDSYIGLENVKKEVRTLINLASVRAQRAAAGLPTVDMSLHMVFSGNPGTGKTTIARFMARVYHSLGILSKGQLVEVDRSGLVAGYVGQTAIKTKKVLDSAVGGVLFIDEAYTLTSGENDAFGAEAVDTVLKAMEDNRGDLVVIVAGYSELMHDFVESNPGLRSRFNKYIEFDDYTPEQLLEILELNCQKGCYRLTEEAKKEAAEFLCVAAKRPESFGGGRGVRNLFETVLSCQANRLAEEKATQADREKLITIEACDVQNGVRESGTLFFS